jgi:hypothetical protein
MGCIALHRLYKVRDEIEAALQLHVDLAPSIVHFVASTNE